MIKYKEITEEEFQRRGPWWVRASVIHGGTHLLCWAMLQLLIAVDWKILPQWVALSVPSQQQSMVAFIFTVASMTSKIAIAIRLCQKEFMRRDPNWTRAAISVEVLEGFLFSHCLSIDCSSAISRRRGFSFHIQTG